MAVRRKRSVPGRRATAWLKRLLAGSGALAVLAVLALSALAMPWTRDGALALAAARLSGDGLEWRFEAASGSLLGRLTLDRATLHSQDQPVLRLEQVVLDWRPAALLSGVLSVRELSVATATVFRLPDGQGDEDGANSTAGEAEETPIDGSMLTDLPFAPHIPALVIDRLVFDAVQAEGSVSAMLDGRAQTGLVLTVEGAAAVPYTDRVSVRLVLDAGTGRVRADMDAGTGPNSLAAHLAAHLAGMDLPVLDMGLAVDGPLDDWRGHVRLDVAGDAVLSGDLSGRRDGAALDGTVTLQRVHPALRGVLQSARQRISVDWRGHDGDAPANGIDGLLTIAVDDAGRGLHIRHGVDLAAPLALDGAEVTVTLPAVVTDLAGASFSTGAATARARLSGTARSPGVEADIRIADAAYGGVPLGSLNGAIAVGMTEDRVTLHSASLTNDSLTNASLASDGLASDALAGAGLAVTGHGWWRRGDGALEAGVDVTRFDLGLGSAWLNRPLDGDVRGEIRVRRAVAGAALEMTVQADAAGLSGDGLPAIVRRAAGPAPRLTAAARIAPDGAATLDSVRLEGQGVRFDVAGRVDRRAGLALDYNLVADDFAGLLDQPFLSGLAALRVDGRVTGPFARPGLTARASLDLLRIEQVALREIALTLDAPDLTDLRAVPVRLAAGTDFGPLAAGVRVSMGAGDVILDGLSARVASLALDGGLTIGTGGLLGGRIAVETLPDRQREQGGFRGGVLDGTLSALVTVAGRQTVSGPVQEARVTATARDFHAAPPSGPGVSVDAADVAGTIRWGGDGAGAGMGADITLSGDRVRVADLLLTRLEAGTTTRDGATAFTLSANGRYREDFDLTADGSASVTGGDGVAVSLALAGRAGDSMFRMAEPVTIIYGGGYGAVAPFSLSVGDGRIDGRLETGPSGVAASLRVDGLDLADVTPFVPDAGLLRGRASGTVSLTGPLDAPEGAVSLALRDLRLTGAGASQESLSLTLDGTLAGGRLLLSGGTGDEDGSDQKGANGGRLNDDSPNRDTLNGGEGHLGLSLTADVPLALNLADGTVDVPVGMPVRARLRASGDLAPLGGLLRLTDHVATGLADLDVRVGGTIAAPTVNGHLNLTDGRYELLPAGLVLEDLALAGRFTGQGLAVDSLTATDGGSGTVRAAGYIALDDQTQDPVVDMTADLSEMTVLRRPDIAAAASARIGFTRRDGLSSLRGSVTVDALDVKIDSGEDTSFVQIEVTEINAPDDAGNGGGNGAGGAARLDPLRLDLTVDIPNRLFTRGRGLDAEWRGALSVTGTSEAPVIAGTASLVRGRFDFAGRQFTLTQGTLAFDGGEEVDPRLDIRADYAGRAIAAAILVSGRASRPDIRLISEPSLPEDEILSRILFGTSVAELSAVEAVQLASSLSALATGGTSVFDRTRRRLGLDRLSVDRVQGGDADNALVGGKYLTNNIYVEVSTTAAGQATGGIEVDLTKNLSLATRLGTFFDNNFRIRWRWVY
ncbi:translocation/assembly module TamB domain-containing protein [Eilatimonas milleporae]|uniref:Autotransporter secretion inner membrane protein TamB n=1 Tax=Eilatimonas milleporae TaxID=911205 RepID=A0A3M0C6N7_9PROT|nr:translocation/assembly module TamB domain-containing protein [Eilatimonas milleporae]RMB04575.1 autotransporter secretion inner membrane protein TamB [Eilatimonas milleporae]